MHHIHTSLASIWHTTFSTSIKKYNGWISSTILQRVSSPDLKHTDILCSYSIYQCFSTSVANIFTKRTALKVKLNFPSVIFSHHSRIKVEKHYIKKNIQWSYGFFLKHIFFKRLATCLKNRRVLFYTIVLYSIIYSILIWRTFLTQACNESLSSCPFPLLSSKTL